VLFLHCSLEFAVEIRYLVTYIARLVWYSIGSSAAKSREEDAQAAIKEFLISGDYSANVAALDSDNLPSVSCFPYNHLSSFDCPEQVFFFFFYIMCHLFVVHKSVLVMRLFQLY
jgi:hypothetical protein